MKLIKPADHSCCGDARSFSGFLYVSSISRFFLRQSQKRSSKKLQNAQAVAQQTGLAKGLIHTKVNATEPEE